MVSVCMATKNGAAFICEQINSILPQLSSHDELIISDDCSTDDTVKIIESLQDGRIKLLRNNVHKGVSKNFENCLSHSTGQFIFLADQDDVWAPHKIKVMVNHLRLYDLVIHDCEVRDATLQPQYGSFFDLNKSGKGLMKNLLKNSYMGCCMAFRRKVLERALPFPHDTPIHDFWIGVIGELHFTVHFIPEQLMFHRRHSANVSSTGRVSHLSFQEKFSYRFRTIKNLFFHKSYAG